MVRSKKHVSKFAWYDEWKRLTDRYGQKWVLSEDGVFWVHTIYHGIGGVFNVTLFRNKKHTEGRTVTLQEFEEKFKVVEVILEQVKV